MKCTDEAVTVPVSTRVPISHTFTLARKKTADWNSLQNWGRAPRHWQLTHRTIFLLTKPHWLRVYSTSRRSGSVQHLLTHECVSAFTPIQRILMSNSEWNTDSTGWCLSCREGKALCCVKMFVCSNSCWIAESLYVLHTLLHPAACAALLCNPITSIPLFPPNRLSLSTSCVLRELGHPSGTH